MNLIALRRRCKPSPSNAIFFLNVLSFFKCLSVAYFFNVGIFFRCAIAATGAHWGGAAFSSFNVGPLWWPRRCVGGTGGHLKKPSMVFFKRGHPASVHPVLSIWAHCGDPGDVPICDRCDELGSALNPLCTYLRRC